MMLQTFKGIRRSALRRPPKAGGYQSRPDTASEALKKLDVFFQFFCNARGDQRKRQTGATLARAKSAADGTMRAREMQQRWPRGHRRSRLRAPGKTTLFVGGPRSSVHSSAAGATTA